MFIDTTTLETLPDRDYRSGLAEVVKYGVSLDASFLELLESHVDELNSRNPEVLRQVIARSCQLKARVVEQDEPANPRARDLPAELRADRAPGAGYQHDRVA